jgi:hypothetical protein
MSRAKTQGAPRKNGKFEARNPKLETMSNDKIPMFQTNSFRSGVLDFDISNISNFEIVSDFDILISNLDKIEPSKSPFPGVMGRLKICAGCENFLSLILPPLFKSVPKKVSY